MDFKELLASGDILQVVSSVITGMGVYILKDLKKSVDKAQESVSRLNASVEVLVLRDEHNKERISLNKDLIKKNEREIITLRNKVHDFGNDLNGLEVVRIKLDDLNKKLG